MWTLHGNTQPRLFAGRECRSVSCHLVEGSQVNVCVICRRALRRGADQYVQRRRESDTSSGRQRRPPRPTPLLPPHRRGAARPARHQLCGRGQCGAGAVCDGYWCAAGATCVAAPRARAVAPTSRPVCVCASVCVRALCLCSAGCALAHAAYPPLLKILIVIN